MDISEPDELSDGGGNEADCVFEHDENEDENKNEDPEGQMLKEEHKKCFCKLLHEDNL